MNNIPQNETTIQSIFIPKKPENTSQDSNAALVYKKHRRFGRFATQVMVNELSFGQNLPLRILRWDQLERLPTILKQYFLYPETEKILCSLKPEKDTLGMLKSLESEEIKISLEGLANYFSEKMRSCIQPNRITPDLRENCIPASLKGNKDATRIWFESLLILLPHIERDIWVTEISNPLPIHAMLRMYDPWALMVLLWCYYKRESIKKFSNDRESALNTVSSIEAFELKSLIIDSFDFWRDYEENTYIGILGPIYKPIEKIFSITSNHEEIRNCFECFMEAVIEIPGWEQQNHALPMKEEIEHTLTTKIPLHLHEFSIRRKTSQNIWKSFRETVISEEDLQKIQDNWGQDELANLANWIIWVERSKEVLKKIKIQTLVGENFLYFPIKKYTQNNLWCMQFSPCNYSIKIFLLQNFDEIEAKLQESEAEILKLKQKESQYEFDLPDVFFNRVRERESAYWGNILLALNNLLHRSHFRQNTLQPNINTNNKEVKEESLLAGVGQRLCAYLMSIANANICTIYRIDFAAEDYPLPKVLASNSRNIELRANEPEIQKSFIEALKEEDNAQLKKRKNSDSLCIRVAALNKESFGFSYTKNTENKVLLTGYPQSFCPQSSLALPLRYNGRVLGIIEFKGLVAKQFSQHIIIPLTRAANLIGPFIYQNLLLREIGKINRMLITTSVISWKAPKNQNILHELCQFLSNILLCPVVHVWQKDQSFVGRYHLTGWSLKRIFTKNHLLYFQLPLSWREVKMVTPLDSNIELNAKTPFAGLSVLQYMVDKAAVVNQNNNENWKPQVGLFSQGFYNPEKEITNYNNWYYDISSKGICLGKDFISKDTGIFYRSSIFDTEQLHQVISFLLLTDTPNINLNPIQTYNSETSTALPWQVTLERTNAIITAHTYGDDDDFNLRGWGKGWTPVIAYLQHYLAYVLDQIDRLAGRKQTVLDILLHEIRNVVGVARQRSDDIGREVHELKFGVTPTLVRKLQTVLDSNSNNNNKDIVIVNRKDLQETLAGVSKTSNALIRNDRRLKEVEKAFLHLTENLEKTNIWNDFFELGLKNISKLERIFYPDHFKDLFETRNEIKNKRCTIKYNNFIENKKYYLETYILIFDLIFENLWSNTIKYVRKDSVIEVCIERDKVLIMNEGFLAKDEKPINLLLPKVRSTRAEYKNIKGHGLGLPFVERAAEVCGLQFKLDTKFIGKVDGIDDVYQFTAELTGFANLSSKVL